MARQALAPPPATCTPLPVWKRRTSVGVGHARAPCIVRRRHAGPPLAIGPVAEPTCTCDGADSAGAGASSCSHGEIAHGDTCRALRHGAYGASKPEAAALTTLGGIEIGPGGRVGGNPVACNA